LRKFIIIIFLMIILTPHSSNAQMPELPDYDPEVYYGYELGASGIASALLKVAEKNIFSDDANEIIINAVNRALEAVWSNRAEFNGTEYAAWSKGPTAPSDYVYPGVKYGAAGIGPVFIDMHQYTGEEIWVERAIDSFDALIDQGVDDIKWPYAYGLPSEEGGLALTGYKYGSAGIAKFAMDLYDTTLNHSYLEFTGEILDYLETIEREVTIDFEDYNLIPWYSMEGSEFDPIFTGYHTGITGIAEIMLEYSEIIDDTKWREYAHQMINFLMEIQNSDGSWYYEYDKEISILSNFDEGVAGIILGMHRMNGILEDKKIDASIESGIDWLFDNYVSNTTHNGFYSGDGEGNIFNSWYTGSLGIIDVLIQLESLLTSSQLEILQSGFNWLLGDACFMMENDDGHELMYLRQEVGNDQFVDLSLSTGSSGLIDILSGYVDRDLPVNLKYNITNNLLDLVSGVMYFQKGQGLWDRQVAIPDYDLISIPTVVTSFTALEGNTVESCYPIFFILPFLRRRRTINQ